MNNGSSITFSPIAGQTLATETFTYTVTDGNGGTNTALITILVTNRPPTAVDDTVSGTNSVPQVINPLGNDTDPDSDALTITNVVAVGGIVFNSHQPTGIRYGYGYGYGYRYGKTYRYKYGGRYGYRYGENPGDPPGKT